MLEIRIYTKIKGKENRIVSLSEASKIARVSRQAILKRINRGEIKAISYNRNSEKVYFVFYKEIKKC